MEVSALKYSRGIGLHGRSPLLRLQSDERLIALVAARATRPRSKCSSRRYETRLLAFCRHLLGSREDAEDVLQEVMTAAFNAMLADDRPINVRPWLYRIARNRSLNHLRRIQTIGVDSMDVHYSDNGASTADKVHEREEFRLLVGDIHELPETQKTALVLREMDALSYEQIAEAMETTVPSVKSLLVRARVSLAEAAEARLLSCDEVRIELGEVAEGLRRRPSPLVRRHLRVVRALQRCSAASSSRPTRRWRRCCRSDRWCCCASSRSPTSATRPPARAPRRPVRAPPARVRPARPRRRRDRALAGSGVALGCRRLHLDRTRRDRRPRRRPDSPPRRSSPPAPSRPITPRGGVHHHRAVVASLGYRNLQNVQALQAQHEPLAPVYSQPERRSSSPTRPHRSRRPPRPSSRRRPGRHRRRRPRTTAVLDSGRRDRARRHRRPHRPVAIRPRRTRP